MIVQEERLAFLAMGLTNITYTKKNFKLRQKDCATAVAHTLKYSLVFNGDFINDWKQFDWYPLELTIEAWQKPLLILDY